MTGLDGMDQAIKEPASIRGSLQKQAILLGCKPDQPHLIGQAGGRHSLTLKPDRAAYRTGALQAGADAIVTVAALVWIIEHRRNAPGSALGLSRHASPNLDQRRMTKASPWREQRNGFKEIGLARPIGAKEINRPPIQRQAGALIGPKVRNRQTAQGPPWGDLRL
jgi:hypothetical protein